MDQQGFHGAYVGARKTVRESKWYCNFRCFLVSVELSAFELGYPDFRYLIANSECSERWRMWSRALHISSIPDFKNMIFEYQMLIGHQVQLYGSTGDLRRSIRSATSRKEKRESAFSDTLSFSNRTLGTVTLTPRAPVSGYELRIVSMDAGRSRRVIG